jgi:hypothetical protein
MDIKISGVTTISGFPTEEPGLSLDDFEVAAAKEIPNAAPAVQSIRAAGGDLQFAKGTVTITGTTVTSGHTSFDLEPLSDVKVKGHGVDVRMQVGANATLTLDS